jgi:hypothetical protein
MASGVISGKTATQRAQMASALATDTCCPTMTRASPAKPGARRRSGSVPAARITGLSRLSALARKARPAAMSSVVSMVRMGLLCRGC